MIYTDNEIQYNAAPLNLGKEKDELPSNREENFSNDNDHINVQENDFNKSQQMDLDNNNDVSNDDSEMSQNTITETEQENDCT